MLDTKWETGEWRALLRPWLSPDRKTHQRRAGKQSRRSFGGPQFQTKLLRRRLPLWLRLHARLPLRLCRRRGQLFLSRAHRSGFPTEGIVQLLFGMFSLRFTSGLFGRKGYRHLVPKSPGFS